MGIQNIDDEIAALNKRLAELQAEREMIITVSPRHSLALALHTKLCHADHTEGCGWHYEKVRGRNGVYEDKWDCDTHQRYLKRADEMIARLPSIDPVDIVRVINAIK